MPGERGLRGLNAIGVTPDHVGAELRDRYDALEARFDAMQEVIESVTALVGSFNDRKDKEEAS